jgi:hypothetical protein
MQRITKPNLVMAPESYIAIILYKHLIQIPKRLINDPRDWLDAGRIGVALQAMTACRP